MIKFHQVLIIFGTLVAIFLFYWFQIRPSDIKSFCASKTTEALSKISEGHDSDFWRKRYDLYFEDCLHKQGL